MLIWMSVWHILICWMKCTRIALLFRNRIDTTEGNEQGVNESTMGVTQEELQSLQDNETLFNCNGVEISSYDGGNNDTSTRM